MPLQNNNETNRLLKEMLKVLKEIKEENITPYKKEWFPIVFHFLQKGYQISTKYIGSSKWGFQQIWQTPLTYDFPFEFDSLHLWTENGNYKPALRMVINGSVYPSIQRFASWDSGSPYYYNREYTGHNYNYMRCFQFSKIHNQQYGSSEYPFKMIVNKNWTLNFEFFQTSTSSYWHYLMIFGWKLHYHETEDVLQELKEAI